MKYTLKHGKCPEDPVNLNSIPASMVYLNNLVTAAEGYHVIYHRLGSVPVNHVMIDHYEIMTSDNRYDDIYINIYNEASSWIPPEGYLFESYPDSMFQQLEERAYPEIPGFEDQIEFDEMYIFSDPLPDEITEEYLSDSIKSMPPLERVLLNSWGTNYRTDNFPWLILEDLLIGQYELSVDKVAGILLDIRPRMTNVTENNEFTLDDEN